MANDGWRSPMRAWVWDRCLLLQAGTLVVDRRRRPYRRLSATVIVAGRRSFLLEVQGETAREYRGVLVAPNVERNYIEAVDADLTILDAGITTAAFQQLEPSLARGGLRSLTDEELDRIRQDVVAAFGVALGCDEAIQLFADVVRTIAPPRAPAAPRDPRVARVMALVEERPFDALSVSALAHDVGISESRLRDLVRKELGCRLSQYMRWVAAWKAVGLWQEGTRFTDVAHAVGFHDLAHADHAFTEIFGLSPSQVTDSRWMTLHKCGP